VSDLDAALRDLGRHVEFPPTPALAVVVAERLRAAPPAPRRRPGLAWARRRSLVVALAAALLAIAGAFAIPPARSAILDFFGLGGVTVERVERQPVFDTSTSRRLGVPVSLDAARRAVTFPLSVPREADVDVLLDRAAPGGAVTFRWRGRRLLLTQFRGETTPYVQKTAGPGTRIEPAEVNGRAAYWLSGARHLVVFRDAAGDLLESRAAGNVLLWEEEFVTFRLEGARSKTEALRIARTLRPVEP
jgi:hypothetical protein